MSDSKTMTDLIPSSMHRRAGRVAGLLLCTLIAGTAASYRAHAVVELNITQGNIQAMPIAIPDFSADGSIDANTAREISNVVANDLKSSGLFLPIDQAAFIEKGLDVTARAAFRGLAPDQRAGARRRQNRQ